MVKTARKWNRQNNKNHESSFSSPKKFKVTRLPIKKRKIKHPGFTLFQFSLYGFFDHDNNIKQGLNNGQS